MTKRNVLGIAAAFALFAQAVVWAQTESAVDLDAAIKEAAVKMGTSLPAKTEVALVSVASSSAQFSEYVISRLEAALVNDGKLVVLDRANLDKVREEQGFQLSGEVDDKSAKDIGKILGAGAIVTGSFINLGDVFGLSLKAINMKTAAVAMSYPADIAKSTRIETLLASGGGTQTARNTGGNKTTPTAPAQSAAAAEPKTYKIGDKGPAGGIVFYDMGFTMNGWRYLEAAPADIPGVWAWGAYHKDMNGIVNGIGSGKRNTQLIVEILNQAGETMKAAQVVKAYEYGGFADWFLPSIDELNLMYTNLKAKGLGGFQSGLYWSSSQGMYWEEARYKNFSNGEYRDRNRNDSIFVRAIRQF